MGSEQIIVAAEGPVRRLLTVDDFLILDEAGAFEGLGRVELIDGEIYVMSPLYKPHAKAQLELSGEFRDAVRRTGLPISAFAPISTRLDEHSAPEPDLVVAAASDEPFVTRETIRIAVEIAASSLRFDLGVKAALYARSGVPEYWVVDLDGRRIIRFSDPDGDTFGQRIEVAFGTRVSSATLDGFWVETGTLG